MNRNTTAETENSNMIEDPEEWKTGDEEMTGAQRSYLQTWRTKQAKRST